MDETNYIDDPDYLNVYWFEKDYHKPLSSWLKKGNWMISVYASIIYVAFIYIGQKLMMSRKPFQLRRYVSLWNLFLAILSFVVFARMAPELVVQVKEEGIFKSLCQMPKMNVATHFWGILFCFSKLLDFGDTVFLVLTKKRVSFLHWYHHVSVTIFSLFVAGGVDASTRWFAVVNSFIHFIMYSYYFLKTLHFNISRKLAMTITMLQISQMVFGIYINTSTFLYQSQGGPCYRPFINIYTALCMYASYLVLFANFFHKAYFSSSKKLKSV